MALFSADSGNSGSVAQLPTASPVCSALPGQLRNNFYLWELDIRCSTANEDRAWLSVSFDSYLGDVASIRPIVETKGVVAAALLWDLVERGRVAATNFDHRPFVCACVTIASGPCV